MVTLLHSALYAYAAIIGMLTIAGCVVWLKNGGSPGRALYELTTGLAITGGVAGLIYPPWFAAIPPLLTWIVPPLLAAEIYVSLFVEPADGEMENAPPAGLGKEMAQCCSVGLSAPGYICLGLLFLFKNF